VEHEDVVQNRLAELRQVLRVVVIIRCVGPLGEPGVRWAEEPAGAALTASWSSSSEAADTRRADRRSRGGS
jgi:hypothetical protein